MPPRKQQTPSPTTTAPSSNAADSYDQSNPLPAGGAPTNAQYRAPIGVGYQTNDTGQDIAVFPDGSSVALNPGETPPSGAKVFHPGQVITDANGAPIPYSAPGDLAPGGTEVPGIVSAQQPSVPAQYREGDEWKEWGVLPPEMQAQVKTALIDKGLISPTNVSLNDVVSGMKQVLAYANSTGQDWTDALRSLPSAATQKTRPRNAYNIQLSSPTDLAAVFKKAVGDLLGGGEVPQAEIDKYVNTYQQMERDAQAAEIHASEENANANAGITQPFVPAGAVMGGPGADQAMPEPSSAPVISTSSKLNQGSAQSLAEQMIRQDFGKQANKYGLLQTYGNFMDLIAGGINNASA